MLAKVGEPLLLDGTGSSDVLGDQISYTWVVSLPSSSHSAFVSFTNPTDEDAIDRGAHIIDSHSAQSRFIADCPGLYHVMLYMRVTRNIDDVSIVDVDASEITVKAVDSNHQMFLDTYMSSTTRAIGHLGYVYEPTISWTSTTARRVTLRGLYGVSAGLGSDKSGWRNGWMIEGMLGMSLRAYDAIQLDLMARVYSRQNQTEDHELRVGSGANISLRLWHNSDLWLWHNSDLWLQLKFQVGFTPLFNYEAQGRFEVVPGMGLAYEH
jgi:hypothetical protein